MPMSQTMEFLINALLVAGIIGIVSTVIYLRIRATTSIEERRNIERRVGILENEVKSMREVHITLESIKAKLESIVTFNSKADLKLEQLGTWQATHQHIVEGAKKFMEEVNKDGVRTKE